MEKKVKKKKEHWSGPEPIRWGKRIHIEKETQDILVAMAKSRGTDYNSLVRSVLYLYAQGDLVERVD